MSKGWSHGSTRAWRSVRARVLRRDGFLCQLKIKGVCTIDAPMRGGHAHHLHGKESGCHGCAADVASHIVAACAACNLKIGDPSRAADRPNRGVTKWT